MNRAAIATAEHKDVRKKKLLAIGTMLEQTLIKDPHKSVNQDMPLPKVFVNSKLYGQSTEQDQATLNSHKAERSNLKQPYFDSAELNNDVSKLSLSGLKARTDFRSGRQMSAKEANISRFLQEWGGTTKGLSSEWVRDADVKVGRPICKRCGKYRCAHQIFSGKVKGQVGRTVATKDPKQISNFSDLQEFQLQNFSPRSEAGAGKNQFGINLSDFKDLVPSYGNTNNTHVVDFTEIAAAVKQKFGKSTMTGKTSEANIQGIKRVFQKQERPHTAEESQPDWYDEKMCDHSFKKPTASFLQKFEFRTSNKLFLLSGQG